MRENDPFSRTFWQILSIVLGLILGAACVFLVEAVLIHYGLAL